MVNQIINKPSLLRNFVFINHFLMLPKIMPYFYLYLHQHQNFCVSPNNISRPQTSTKIALNNPVTIFLKVIIRQPLSSIFRRFIFIIILNTRLKTSFLSAPHQDPSPSKLPRPRLPLSPCRFLANYLSLRLLCWSPIPEPPLMVFQIS